MNSADPALTAILLTPDNYQTLRRTIQHLRAQTVAHRMEVIIVCTDLAALRPITTDLNIFHSYQTLQIDSLRTTGPARAMAIGAAQAPAVVFCEDHCYPEPTWAAALMHRHEEDWAVVSPNLGNANPRTLRSWAIFYNAYGPHINQKPGPATSAAGHNASYKKRFLEPFSQEELADLLEVEWFLQQRIREAGGQIYYEPAARTFHLNMSRWSSWIDNHFAMGRVFGAQRSRRYNAFQRLFGAARTVLLPFVRYSRLRHYLREAGDDRTLPDRVLLLMFVGLCLSAMGEMVGSLAGMGQSLVEFSHAEFHRETGMNERDRQELFELDAENGLELANPREAA